MSFWAGNRQPDLATLPPYSIGSRKWTNRTTCQRVVVWLVAPIMFVKTHILNSFLCHVQINTIYFIYPIMAAGDTSRYNNVLHDISSLIRKQDTSNLNHTVYVM